MGNYGSGKTADLCLEWLRSGGEALETGHGDQENRVTSEFRDAIMQGGTVCAQIPLTL